MTNLLVLCCCVLAQPDAPALRLEADHKGNTVQVLAGDEELLAYQYDPKWGLPHLYPLRSPSGKLLTAQQNEPYPHHRSLWIADRVQMGKLPAVDFYHCWKNYNRAKDPASGFRHAIRHEAFNELKAEGSKAVLNARLLWIVNKETPVLEEQRRVQVTLLAEGEYLLDIRWKLTAAYGDVRFLSDSVHYAWPYLRIHPQFSGEQGGAILNDQGGRGQAGTHDKTARWVDFSNTVEGATEGLAVFADPALASPPQWLTREYGTFGPRRPLPLSGTKFTLAKGDSLEGHAGVFVHRGDAKQGRVEEQCRAFRGEAP
ncbi:MAG: PmoA family protein [Pirellulales bacterium]|nr:PmoA family protein [Pirellulales bacterium]